MILSLLYVLAAPHSISYWITRLVFILGGLAFAGAGGMAMAKKDDPNQTITPGKAIAMLIVGGILLLVGLFFIGSIID